MSISRLRIERLEGGLLEIDGGSLTQAFFLSDRSSMGEMSFDALAGRTASDRIDASDVAALNRSMRARSKADRWLSISNVELPWLVRLDTGLDLIEADDAWWESIDADALVRDALVATVADGRGLSVATKMLHLKRPRLFPIIDRLVAEMLGFAARSSATPERRAQEGQLFVAHLRTEGRRNIDELRAIQGQLESAGVSRSLARILDAALWSSHPAASAPGKRIFATTAG